MPQTFSLEQIKHGPYTMQVMKSTSCVLEHLASPMVRATILVHLLFQFLYLLLCGYVASTLPASEPASEYHWRLWALTCTEILVLFVDIIVHFQLLISILCRARLQDRPRYRLLGDDLPRVDVLILACGEDTAIALDTIAAATALYYPIDCLEFFLLDDGRSPDLQLAVKTFNDKQEQKGHKTVIYMSRVPIPGTPNHFKAGNLNFGLRETQKLSGADFVMSLDIDMIVQPEWLRAVLPHLVLDDKVAIATPTQVTNPRSHEKFGPQLNLFSVLLQSPQTGLPGSRFRCL